MTTGPIGLARIDGDRGAGNRHGTCAREGIPGPRGVRAQAERATSQLLALDQAVRGISGVLDVDRVLQLIADRVRELVEADTRRSASSTATAQSSASSPAASATRQRARIGDLPRGRGLLGLIIRENRTYRIPEIGAHPESYGFPANHPPMYSSSACRSGTRRSRLDACTSPNKRDAAEFSEADQALVEMFALHAGIAIENARLHDQVRPPGDRRRARPDQPRPPRQRHPGDLRPDPCARRCAGAGHRGSGRGRGRVDEAIDALHAVIRDIRNFIFGLRPVLLESGDLAEGLEHLATELRRNGGVDVAVSVPDDPAHLALPLETVAELLASTREALSNIARHAAATNAGVVLAADDSRLRLEITDDGRGFDAGARGRTRPSRAGEHARSRARRWMARSTWQRPGAAPVSSWRSASRARHNGGRAR